MTQNQDGFVWYARYCLAAGVKNMRKWGSCALALSVFALLSQMALPDVRCQIHASRVALPSSCGDVLMSTGGAVPTCCGFHSPADFSLDAGHRDTLLTVPDLTRNTPAKQGESDQSDAAKGHLEKPAKLAFRGALRDLSIGGRVINQRLTLQVMTPLPPNPHPIQGFSRFPKVNIRVPAEWEPQEAIWLQWPERFEKAHQPAFAQITNVIVQYQKLHILCDNHTLRNAARAAIRAAGGNPDDDNITWHLIANDNAWMRDNGPLYVVQDGQMRIQNWQFDAWGGAFGDAVAYRKDNAVPVAIGAYLNMPVDTIDIVHERGNLEFNGKDTVILNWSTIGDPRRNPLYTRNEAIADMKKYFGVSKVVLIEGVHEGDFTNGHIDGIARFINENTVVVPQCTQRSLCKPGDGKDDKVNQDAADAIAAAGLTVIRMPLEGAVTYQGDSFDATYMNWVVGNGFVIVAGFDNPATDAPAKARIQSYFPHRNVHLIEMLASWRAGGGAHCHTNDQPRFVTAL